MKTINLNSTEIAVSEIATVTIIDVGYAREIKQTRYSFKVITKQGHVETIYSFEDENTESTFVFDALEEARQDIIKTWKEHKL